MSISASLELVFWVAIIVGVVVLYFRITPYWNQPTRLLNLSSSSLSSSDLEALVAIVFIAAVGVAAIQFIRSGGLKRLLETIGALAIEVDGRRTTIAAAARDSDLVARLLRQAVEAKLLSLDQRALAAENVDRTSVTAANDVAQMLRDALATRMRQRGI